MRQKNLKKTQRKSRNLLILKVINYFLLYIKIFLESNIKLLKNEMGLVETIKGTETLNLNEYQEKKNMVCYL